MSGSIEIGCPSIEEETSRVMVALWVSGFCAAVMLLMVLRLSKASCRGLVWTVSDESLSMVIEIGENDSGSSERRSPPSKIVLAMPLMVVEICAVADLVRL